MSKYNVEIVETLSRVVEIEAQTYEEAEEKAEEMYDKVEIVLDYEDKEDVNYKPYPSQKIKDNYIITVDFDKDEKNVYISTKNSSGANYKCETKDDLKSAINTYINNYIELENVKAIKERNTKNKGREER